MAKVTVIGDKELIRYFDKLGTSDKKIIVRKVVKESAEETRDFAQAIANRRTGEMADSIDVKMMGYDKAFIGPGRDAFYAVIVHKGTGPRMTRERTKPRRFAHSTGSMPKSPFMERAIKSMTVEKKARDVFKREIRRRGAE